MPALESLLALKKPNPELKIIVSVGVWTADSFANAALTDASQDRFAQSAIELLRRYKVNGIDIDWDYPGAGHCGNQAPARG